MSMRRSGEHVDELISASLTGDLTNDEQARLDAHLAQCAQCRETADDWSRQRRLISDLRQLPVPRDLAPRIRAGIESGRYAAPWWRRSGWLVGIGASVASVAAVVLGVLVLGNALQRPVASTVSPVASASITPSAQPSVSSEPSPPNPTATAPATQSPPPVVAVREPVARFTYRLQDQQPVLRLVANDGESELEIGQNMTPIDAALSPDGDWLAFRAMGDDSGLVSTFAYRQSDETLIGLGQQGMDSPFARLSWSTFGELLAYTYVDQEGSADVWVLDTRAPEPAPVRITDTGRTFAGSFYGGGNEAWLWVSTAEEGSPTSYRIALPLQGSLPEPGDPADESLVTYPGVFLPIDSHEGPFDEGPAVAPIVAFWAGEMTQADGVGWLFSRGGMLYRTYAGLEGDLLLQPDPDFQVFDTLQVQPNGAAFESARFAWAPDRDGLAVWDARWSGVQQPDGFPDSSRVYYAHASTGPGTIGPLQALDAMDTQGNRVVHVGLGGGQFLAVTVATAAGAHSGAYGPTAELRLVTRNLGDVPDEVETFGQQRVWVGPGVYPAYLSSEE
jgi:hypothetical protein